MYDPAKYKGPTVKQEKAHREAMDRYLTEMELRASEAICVGGGFWRAIFGWCFSFGWWNMLLWLIFSVRGIRVFGIRVSGPAAVGGVPLKILCLVHHGHFFSFPPSSPFTVVIKPLLGYETALWSFLLWRRVCLIA